MDFNWINSALSADPIRDRVPATCFTWKGHVIATDRARVHIWTDPDAAMFCATDTTPLLMDRVSQLFNAIDTLDPEFIFEERQDDHWVYLQICQGQWLTFERKYYEELKIPFSDSLPCIGQNDWGKFICFKSGNCMGALMEYKTK